MAEKRVIIEHRNDPTLRYSVTEAAHKELYPTFKVVGDESDEAFTVTGVPKPKRPRTPNGPRQKAAAPIAKPAAPVETP